MSCIISTTLFTDLNLTRDKNQNWVGARYEEVGGHWLLKLQESLISPLADFGNFGRANQLSARYSLTLQLKFVEFLVSGERPQIAAIRHAVSK